MAKRPAFIVNTKDKSKYVEEIDFDFEWFSGYHISQKRKTIKSLHKSIKSKYPNCKILEVSSKSEENIGVKLSAFNLQINNEKTNRVFTVESAFQSSKAFENGGPFLDLLSKTSREAKQDVRLRESGKLKYFEFFGEKWALEPKTAFYDWLYINAVYKKPNLVKNVLEYNVFTDIEFNPKRSINCQARALALFVSLYKRGLIDEDIKSPNKYMQIVYGK